MDIWFASDHHLGHKNIITYQNRPFNDIEEMKNTIIERHNSVVKPGDKVFFLGDFCMGDKKNIEEYISKFNGDISLIMGNHERYKPTDYISAGFVWATRFPIIYDKRMILSHDPVIDEDAQIGKWYMNIHGHLHQSKIEKLGYYNCCVERINYLPIHYETIRKLLFLK